ncbi:unnamed protein product [Gongylonema pulchrum]|uniref:Ribonuclease/ribotoxin n=1 Tax=Gongylonema pulchrum TaxID=637853 RepID=A0A183DV46_9BILA|nr:unnamed protein product [Gongylonema pulchrum]
MRAKRGLGVMLSLLNYRVSDSVLIELFLIVTDCTCCRSVVLLLKTAVDDVECAAQTINCGWDEKAVHLRPESLSQPPVICLNKRRLFDASKLAKGLNIAVLNGKSLNWLSAEARHLLQLFGLALEQYKTGYSIMFIGQLGLSTSQAFQKVTMLGVSAEAYYHKCLASPTPSSRKMKMEGEKRNSTDVALVAAIIVSLSAASMAQFSEAQAAVDWLGKLSDVTVKMFERHHIDEGIISQLSAVKGSKMHVNFGSELPNCGRSESCPKGEMAMSFYSGKDKDDSPQLCVNGRFVFDRNLNSAGRGLNLVVIDSKTHQVMRTGHYDTYNEGTLCLCYIPTNNFV